MSRRTRRRRALVVLCAFFGGLALIGALVVAGRLGGDRVVTASPVEFDGARGIQIVGASTESVWWLTPQVTSGPSGIVTITVPADVLFPVDSAAVGPLALAALAEVAKQFRLHPGSTISAACYTDESGSTTWNLSLSRARARAVAAALLSIGVPENVISATGYGATDFVADNTTPTGRALNRRCQFTVMVPRRAPSP